MHAKLLLQMHTIKDICAAYTWNCSCGTTDGMICCAKGNVKFVHVFLHVLVSMAEGHKSFKQSD